MRTWTKAYYGVQHLKPLPRGWQVTIEAHEGWVDAYVLAPGHGFTPIAEEVLDTVEAACAWGERQAQALIGKVPA